MNADKINVGNPDEEKKSRVHTVQKNNDEIIIKELTYEKFWNNH